MTSKKTASAVMFDGFANELTKICALPPGLSQRLASAENMAASALSKAEGALSRKPRAPLNLPKTSLQSQLERLKAERELAKLKAARS